MTAMPELVPAFSSLVGLAAVFVAIAAFLNPEAFNLGSPGKEAWKLNLKCQLVQQWVQSLFQVQLLLF